MTQQDQLKQAFFWGAILVAGLGYLGGQAWAFVGLGLWFLILVALWLGSAWALKQMVARTDGMPERTIQRNQLGFPLRVQAKVAGRDVRVSGASVQVDLRGSGVADVTHTSDTLAALARAPVPLSGPARALSAAGVRSVRVQGERLQLTAGSGPLQPLVEAALALVGCPAGVRLQASSASACPYCHQPVSFREEAMQRCKGCEALHHDACWREHGGCAVFGCERGPRREPERPRAADPKEQA